ncbi:MAG: response regulator, partial [Chitinophagaceae bacterium]
MSYNMVTVAIADDHQLFVKSLGLMLNSFQHYKVVTEAKNGKDLIDKLELNKIKPDIILLDVNMPVMDGFETAAWLQKHRPNSKVVALSMNDGDEVVLKMIKAGCCAYFLKDTHPNELEKALDEIVKRG